MFIFSGMKLVSHHENFSRQEQLYGKRPDDNISNFWPISYPEAEITGLKNLQAVCVFYVC
jgi:hypothetical protein